MVQVGDGGIEEVAIPEARVPIFPRDVLRDFLQLLRKGAFYIQELTQDGCGCSGREGSEEGSPTGSGGHGNSLVIRKWEGHEARFEQAPEAEDILVSHRSGRNKGPE
jgi:hypothetical protein